MAAPTAVASASLRRTSGTSTSPTSSAVLGVLEGVQSSVGVSVSMADLIVLGGAAAVEAAAKAGGHDVTVSVSTGRGDASQEQTDVESFAWLEPKYDGFRNFLGKGSSHVAEHLLVDSGAAARSRSTRR